MQLRDEVRQMKTSSPFLGQIQKRADLFSGILDLSSTVDRQYLAFLASNCLFLLGAKIFGRQKVVPQMVDKNIDI
jgi:hypothetical protein